VDDYFSPHISANPLPHKLHLTSKFESANARRNDGMIVQQDDGNLEMTMPTYALLDAVGVHMQVISFRSMFPF
jgi:hypothetical protein